MKSQSTVPPLDRATAAPPRVTVEREQAHCTDVSARTIQAPSGLQRAAVTILAAAALAFIGSAAWAKEMPPKTNVATDLQCMTGCVEGDELESGSVNGSKVIDGSLTKADLSFEPQLRVNNSCGPGSSIREINGDGTVVCETDDDTNTDTDTLSDLAATCPDGSFLQLDPDGSGEWHCLSLIDMKLALGLATQKIVFVTAETFDGTLNNTSGNLLCNQSASDAGLQGDGENNYFAWLSYGFDSPLDSVAPSALYTLVDGTPVFEKADLEICDFGVACLAHPIDLDASAANQSGQRVWTGWGTGNNIDGFANEPSASNCDGWTKNSHNNSYLGNVGLTSGVDASWTYQDVDFCDTSNRLYCMER